MEMHSLFRVTLKWDATNDHRFEVIEVDERGNQKGEPIPFNEGATLAQVRTALQDAQKKRSS